jgi:hypothetical protein
MTDKVKKEKIGEGIKKYYKSLDIEIIDCVVLQRNQYVNGEWKTDVPALFFDIKIHKNINDTRINSDLLTDLFGYEININVI